MATPPDLPQPHDSFFKETFGRPEVAADFLQNYLPASVVALLQLDRLELQRETFIDPDLQEHFSDLLYHAPLRDGEQANVYILFEHKSYPDRLVAFQLLRYMVRIWERALRQDSSLPLAPIIPVVVYHGRTPWRIEANFSALYIGLDELRRYWPVFEFQLTDLSSYSDEQLRGNVTLKATTLLLKHIADPRLRTQIPRFVSFLSDLMNQETGLEYLQTFLRYMTSASESITEIEVRQMVDSILSTRGSAIMATIAQKWLEQGIEKGREEGLEQGIEQGIEQGAQALRGSILAVLRVRFALSDEDLAPVAHQLGRVTDLKELEVLHLNALQAATLADFARRLQARPAPPA
jgi:predicted transposase/invertase (TIGR01784 family)